MADGCGRTWRTMCVRSGRADERTGANEADRRMGRKGRGQLSGRTDRAHEARTGGRAEEARTGPSRRGRADERTGRSGPPLHGRRVGRTNGRADERVGLGLKGHIPRGSFHSWAPSPLASLERKCAGCLGVQWGPIGFHVNHPYLAPGLPCLV